MKETKMETGITCRMDSPADRAIDLAKRGRQIAAIERSLLSVKHSVLGPRQKIAFISGSLTAFCVSAALIELQKLDILDSGSSPWIALTPWVAGFACMMAVAFVSKRPKTWNELLDKQLANYEPIDKDAYQRLQEQTQRLGRLDVFSATLWAENERADIRHRRHALSTV